MPRVNEPGVSWRKLDKVPPKFAPEEIINNHLVLSIAYVEMFGTRRYDKYRVRTTCCEHEYVRSEKQLVSPIYAGYAKAGGCPRCRRKLAVAATTSYTRQRVLKEEEAFALYQPLIFAFISAPAPLDVASLPFPWH